MESIWDFIEGRILPHYPFVVGYFGFVLIGEFMKRQAWTKERAKDSKFFDFMRSTMALHAPVAGAVLGLMPGMIASPGVVGFWPMVLYWTGCGIFASFSFHALSDYLKKRTGGELDLDKALENAVTPSMYPSPLPPKPDPDE